MKPSLHSDQFRYTYVLIVKGRTWQNILISFIVCLQLQGAIFKYCIDILVVPLFAPAFTSNHYYVFTWLDEPHYYSLCISWRNTLPALEMCEPDSTVSRRSSLENFQALFSVSVRWIHWQDFYRIQFLGIWWFCSLLHPSQNGTSGLCVLLTSCCPRSPPSYEQLYYHNTEVKQF